MKYQYEEKVIRVSPGDVVQAVNTYYEQFTEDKLYVAITPDLVIDDRGIENGFSPGFRKEQWRILKTLLGSEAKPGDTIICISNPVNHNGALDTVAIGECKICQEHTATSHYMYWSDKSQYNSSKHNWRVICTEPNKPILDLSKVYR